MCNFFKKDDPHSIPLWNFTHVPTRAEDLDQLEKEEFHPSKESGVMNAVTTQNDGTSTVEKLNHTTLSKPDATAFKTAQKNDDISQDQEKLRHITNFLANLIQSGLFSLL